MKPCSGTENVKASGSFQHDSARCLQVQTEEGNIHAKSITEVLDCYCGDCSRSRFVFPLAILSFHSKISGRQQIIGLLLLRISYYQLHTENWPHYTFLDQNVSEVTLDGHQIRTMEIKTEWGNRYIQAVAVKTTFGEVLQIL